MHEGTPNPPLEPTICMVFRRNASGNGSAIALGITTSWRMNRGAKTKEK
jgi:hypothetical protein